MGAVTPETCRVALHCILLHLLDFYSHWITMHGTMSLKKMEFIIDIILPATQCSWGRLSLWQKWVPGIFPGEVKAASAQRWQPYHLHVPIVLKSGRLNLLETSGLYRDCFNFTCYYPSNIRSVQPTRGNYYTTDFYRVTKKSLGTWLLYCNHQVHTDFWSLCISHILKEVLLHSFLFIIICVLFKDLVRGCW